jgi:hypothetical protein
VLTGVISQLHSHHADEHPKDIADTTNNQLTHVAVSNNQDAVLHEVGLTTILLIVASANRPDYLKKTLSYVTKYHPK